MTNHFERAIEILVRSSELGSYRLALIGGFALPFHGVVRTTQDVDVLAEEEGVEDLHGRLTGSGERLLSASGSAPAG